MLLATQNMGTVLHSKNKRFTPLLGRPGALDNGGQSLFTPTLESHGGEPVVWGFTMRAKIFFSTQKTKDPTKILATSKAGFTLLETVVAVAVLLAAVVGPVALITHALRNVQEAKNKLIAANLAQEGVELVRVIRENNILCLAQGAKIGPNHWPWDMGYNGGGTLYGGGSNRTIDATDFHTVSCIASVTVQNPRMGSSNTSCLGGAGASPALKIDSSGRYGYVSGTDTVFHRCTNITRSGTSESTPFGMIPADDTLDVSITVMWYERNVLKTVGAQERLYNWK